MIIEIGDNGLRSRYYWTSYDILDDAIYCATPSRDPDTMAAIAAYLAVLSRCKFLTKDNHDWEAKDYGPCKPEHQALKDYTQSSRYTIIINHKTEQGPFRIKYWFHFAYRVPGQSY